VVIAGISLIAMICVTYMYPPPSNEAVSCSPFKQAHFPSLFSLFRDEEKEMASSTDLRGLKNEPNQHKSAFPDYVHIFCFEVNIDTLQWGLACLLMILITGMIMYLQIAF
jgi:hypothetical protein